MTVTLDDGGAILNIEGYTCSRGKAYAESEITHPVRTLTSTVTVTSPEGKKMLPVRTGEVLIPDFIEPGTNLIACRDA